MPNAYPRLADPSDIPRLISGDQVSSQWPPPGCTVIPVGFPESWGLITGDLSALPAGQWYVTTLAEFVLSVPAEAASILARAARSFSGPISLFAGAVGHWPVIYEVGKGATMRWIHSVLRGTLGGVEQFQFQVNWGQPGADPDLSVPECAAFAQSLATKWQTTWNAPVAGTGGAPFSSQYPTDVKFTEVGVCMLNQTDGTSADGSGGNLSQPEPTEWAPINGIAGVVGTSAQPSLPYEVSEAITLHTNKRGPSGRGRLYFPPMAVQGMATGGKYVSGWATGAGIAMGDFFELVTADDSHVPVVVSRRRIILNEVVEISCGLIPDSQRRRRWAQLEAPIVTWTKPA